MTWPPLVVGWKWCADGGPGWTEVDGWIPGAVSWCETDMATEPAAMAATTAAAAMKGAGRWLIDDAVMMTSVGFGWSLDGAPGVDRTECDVRRWKIGVRVNAYVS